MVRHRLGAALHVDAFEVGVDELALVELGLDAIPVRVDALVRAGRRVEADEFPCFSEAFLLLGRPLDARLACPGRPLLLLAPLRRCRRRLLLLLLLLLLWVLRFVHVLAVDVAELGLHVTAEIHYLVLGGEPGRRGGRGRSCHDDVVHVGLGLVGVAEVREGQRATA